MQCELRDITQAYVQSTNKLLRTLYAKLLKELRDKFPLNIILRIDKLRMRVSLYDPCLLITEEGENPFSITGLQTNNTLSVVTLDFLHREEEELHRLDRTKLFIFTDGLFANNKDLSLQLSFLIILVNERCTGDGDSFKIYSNIIYWNLIKCKRVTRSVLASELYGIVGGFNSAIALNSKLLYNCLVKLGTTNEKRLIIDIMSLRELYENREISKIRWINSKNNPADAFTKKAPNPALEQLILLNTLNI
ncbi:hypothetical protein K504DRAFT_477587 [Pleomassaria siparia CBS 279.74]|uniref:Uncharacterized protein n=1 Tax=Pleomassaria siparia CBS 279.74 TaxID=1314801 RepID=A0A6G1K697_9PLEO|nr:hypothetical protein K504DRAFT_477587 [Pleomassaria siparia CBS 279.74]